MPINSKELEFDMDNCNLSPHRLSPVPAIDLTRVEAIATEPEFPIKLEQYKVTTIVSKFIKNKNN